MECFCGLCFTDEELIVLESSYADPIERLEVVPDRNERLSDSDDPTTSE